MPLIGGLIISLIKYGSMPAILPSTPMLDSSPTSAELYSTRENYYYYNSLLWAFRGPRICIQDAAALKEENQCVDIYDK